LNAVHFSHFSHSFDDVFCMRLWQRGQAAGK
jgi:hypothetical protein